MSQTVILPLVGSLLFASVAMAARNESFFCPPPLVAALRANAAADPAMAEACAKVVAQADAWAVMSDEQLWDSMFGATIERSWMVLSDGDCPACHKPVPMYNWHMDAVAEPWKVHCPHCQQRFPTNDFGAFYRSGLDEHGIFDHARADRSLLFNTEHPAPSDPLHTFGVDDGTGFKQGDRTWRFIGTYLIYGHWYQLTMPAVTSLSEAYVVTGDPRYAHKAAVLLDRIADLYPSFDLLNQGYVYEQKGQEGYVTNWHNACQDTLDLAMAYDRIRPAMGRDAELVAFLSNQAQRHGLANPKATADDIHRNIEQGILIHPALHPDRIACNYPKREITLAVLKTVLDWPANRDDVQAMMDAMIAKATAVDGVTGEKGIAGYAYFTIHSLAQMLQQYAMVQSDLLPSMIRRHPTLLATWRFHLDTWCLDSYYPLVGDCGVFARKEPNYLGLATSLLPDPKTGKVAASLKPSMYSFLWALYQASGDVDYVRLMWRANGNSTAGLPHDIYCLDQAFVRRQIEQIIAQHGADFNLPSINKQQWHLGILRSGRGGDRRALWMEYQSGGGHGHLDGLNLGLFAHGMDLLPDLGYPPVQYGGWYAPKASWYMQNFSHNTVAVNGKKHKQALGQCLLWADAGPYHAMAARIEGIYKDCSEFARAAVMLDVSDEAFYVLDVFRVAGGKEHIKLTHSLAGQMSLTGVQVAPVEGFIGGELMREFSGGSAQPGWEAHWKLEDRWDYLPKDRQVQLRYIDLTDAAVAGTARMWVSPSLFGDTTEWWIPRVWVRRQSEQPNLESMFVSVLEPHEGPSAIAGVRRLEVACRDGLAANTAAGVEVTLADGRRDVLLVDLGPDVPLTGTTAPASQAAATASAPAALVSQAATTSAPASRPAPTTQPAATRRQGMLWGCAQQGIWLEGRSAWIRYAADGQVQRVVLGGGSRLITPAGTIQLDQPMDHVEAVPREGRLEVLSTSPLTTPQALPQATTQFR